MPRPGTGILPESSGLWTVCRREALATGGVLGRVEALVVAALCVHDRHPGARRQEDLECVKVAVGRAGAKQSGGVDVRKGTEWGWGSHWTSHLLGSGVGAFPRHRHGQRRVSLKALVLLMRQTRRST